MPRDAHLPHAALTRGIQAWHRERRAFPELVAVRPGAVLSREYKGVDHAVLVLHAGYRWRGEDYFTLGDIVAALVPSYRLARNDRPGPRYVRSQSARRFFYDAVLAAAVDADGR